MVRQRPARMLALGSALWMMLTLVAAITAIGVIGLPWTTHARTSTAEASAPTADFEPTPAYPFGRPNPNAPAEIAQFEFMIGECDCVDEIRNPDGSWRRTAAVWNAKYFLNGHAIQDLYWSDSFATSNIRIFDPDRGRWFVNFFSMPSPNVSPRQWVGKQEREGDDTRMVMWAGSADGKNGSRLTFFDIRDEGFRWKSEVLVEGVATVGWKSDCRRRKPGNRAEVPKFMGFDPNAVHPFGRRHPDAAAGFGALEFLVGRHESEARIRTTNYFLNGHGLQTRTFAPKSFESGFVLHDRTRNVWSLYRFRMPGYAWAVFEGSADEGELDLRRTLQVGSGWGDGIRFVPSPGGYDEIVTSHAGETICRVTFRE